MDFASWATTGQFYRPLGGPEYLLHLLSTTTGPVGGAFRSLLAGAAGAVAGGTAMYMARPKSNSASVIVTHTEVQPQERLLRAAADQSLDAFYILESLRDENGEIVDFVFTYLNDQARRYLNGESLDHVGKSYRETMGWITDDLQIQRYCEVVATGVPYSVELPVDRADSKTTWLRRQVVPLGDGVAVTSIDLTDLKLAEDRFRNLAEFGDLLFENAPFAMMSANSEGVITAMNQQAEILTGYSRNALIDKSSMLLLHDPQELCQRASERASETGERHEGFELIACAKETASNANRSAAPVQRSGIFRARSRTGMHLVAATGDQAPQAPAVHEEEWTYIRRDGTRIPVSVAVKVLRGATGERTGVVCIVCNLINRRQSTSMAAPRPMRDTLTGLIGEGLLDDRISQALERGRRARTKVAVYNIDLDSFRRINEAHGHRVGDELLMAAARRLMEKVRKADTVARINGDEFIVVVSDQSKVSDIEFFAEHLLRALSAPYLVFDHTIELSFSIGIAVAPDLAADTEQMLRRSEAAVFAAKEAGGACIRLFAPTMLNEAASRVSMEGALRQSLDRNELFLEYQPQVSLPGGEVIGMEALMRWKHPRFGLVSPAHFIPMAEQMGLLPEFGSWAMHRACQEAKWMQKRLARRLCLGVNLSPQQFQQHKLLDTVQSALQKSGLAPSDLEIEITENTLMINSQSNLETLQMIRDLGVRLSIDDFGTGFCNFNYLLQYQVDRLKIDQSFVRQSVGDANAASVVRTITALSHGLGIKVIAEGVETKEQLKFLLRRRCDQAQGFYFARPLSADRFVEAVAGIEAMDVAGIARELGAARKHHSPAAHGRPNHRPVVLKS